MKHKFIYMLFCMGVLLACKESSKFENRVYITGTEASDTRQLVVDGVPSEVAFSVTLADLFPEAVEVEVAADNNLVEAYNRKYYKNYKPMPDGSFDLSTSTLRIDPENLRSNSAKVIITDDSQFEEGASYLIPVTIKSVNGKVKVLDASKTVYFTVLKIIDTKACDLKGQLYFRVDFSKHNDQSLTALAGATMETRFYCTNTMTSNPYISSIMGLEENWLVRMGDARNIPDNAVQVAGSGSNATAPNPVPLKEWHHVAVVFENSSVKLYIDGNLESQSPHPGSPSFDGKPKSTPGCINLMSVYGDPSFSIGISANAASRRWNGYFSEMRVWRKALTRTDIVNNMCYVDPASPDLVAYWRFDGSTAILDDGTEAVLDHTGNGYDAIPSLPIQPANWVEHVKCPNQ